MSDFVDCPDCTNKILSRMGTICPKCGFTVGYFNGEDRRKGYGRLFALTIFAPFFSLFTIIFAQINLYSFIVAILLAIFLAIKSCPIRFKTVFASKFEKWFFWSIWSFVNIFLIVVIVNIFLKFI